MCAPSNRLPPSCSDRVSNVTRNITVQTDMLVPSGALGTSGPTAYVRDDASWDVRHSELRGLGRIGQSACIRAGDDD